MFWRSAFAIPRSHYDLDKEAKILFGVGESSDFSSSDSRPAVNCLHLDTDNSLSSLNINFTRKGTLLWHRLSNEVSVGVIGNATMTNGNIASKLAEALSLNIHFSPRFFTASTLQIGYRHLSASHMWELHGHPVLLSLGARFGFAGESLSPQKATFKMRYNPHSSSGSARSLILLKVSAKNQNKNIPCLIKASWVYRPQNNCYAGISIEGIATTSQGYTLRDSGAGNLVINPKVQVGAAYMVNEWGVTAKGNLTLSPSHSKFPNARLFASIEKRFKEIPLVPFIAIDYNINLNKGGFRIGLKL